MTHDERARWKKDFKSTLDSMVELLKRAPAIGITQEVPEFHIDAITDMGEEMLADVSLQSLSKPRDPDAQQARFVIAAAAGCAAILGWTRGTTLLISVCGSILFDDELSERTVRRWLAKPIPFDYGQISR
jgi:hypothetical protein